MAQQGMAFNAAVAAPFATAARWLKAWVTIGTLVILVVIGYLLAIVNALQNINENLDVTDANVAGIAQEDVAPLPAHIDTINTTLDNIDQVLKPIPGQATSIINSLTTIDGTLKEIDPTLVSINGGLTTALGGLRNIENTLIELDTAGRDGAGLQPIVAQVTVIRDKLVSVSVQDTPKIDVDLTNRGDGVATHVRNICQPTSGGRRCGN